MIHYALTPRALAGAFDSEDALDEWLESVPRELRQRLGKHADVRRSFPAFLVESNGFAWANESDLRVVLAVWSQQDRPIDWVYGNVFFLDGPWQPPRPGTDYMGVIPHIHVERRHLDLVQRSGLDALHESWLGPESLAQIRLARG